VGTLLVSKMGRAEMFDGNEFMQALLYQWPFARMLGVVKQAVAKKGITIKEFTPYYDARRCPNLIAGNKRCGHVHETRPVTPAFEERRQWVRVGDVWERQHVRIKVGETFECEVCHFTRPADTVVAWNGLFTEIGPEPMAKAKEMDKKLKEIAEKLRDPSKEVQAGGVVEGVGGSAV